MERYVKIADWENENMTEYCKTNGVELIEGYGCIKYEITCFHQRIWKS